MSDTKHAPTPLVVYDDDESDVLYITTDARLENHKGVIAQIEVGFDEPYDSEQRAYAADLVHRYNSHDELVRLLTYAVKYSGAKGIFPDGFIEDAEAALKAAQVTP